MSEFNNGFNNEFNSSSSNGPASQPAHNLAVAALVTGIIGCICCLPCSIAAIILSKKAEGAGNTEGINKAGFILGIVGIAITVVGMIIRGVSG